MTNIPPGATLARDDHVDLSVYASLPAQVSQALVNTDIDLYTDTVNSYIDSASGFAYVLTQRECFVWNYAKRALFSPTAYVFPCPSAIHSSGEANLGSSYTLPAAILTSPATSREPGLLLISPNGVYRFWEHVGMALSGVDKFIEGQLNDLSDGETVTGLFESDPSHYILTTSLTNLKHVVLAPSQGRLYPIIRPFPRTRGVFARLFSSGAYSTSEQFAALTLSQPDSFGSRDLFAIGERSVQVWSIGYASAAASSSNASKFVGQYHIRDAIADRIIPGSGFDIHKARLSVSMLDGAVTKDGKLAVLVSYITPNKETNDSDQLQSYALCLLVHTQDPTQPWSVEKIQELNYQAHLDPRPYSIPKLVVYEGGPAFFVVFSDAILISTLVESLKYSMLLPLQYPLNNKFIGFGITNDPTRALASPSNSQVLESTKASIYTFAVYGGIISTQLDLEKLEADIKKQIDPTTRLTSRLKSRLEQAIFYGDKQDNPISFAIPNGHVEGDLQEATKSVSKDILASRSTNMPVILDLRAQINDRAVRCYKLIQFISENGLLGKLAPSTRRQLCDDAEKLVAANELWLHENSEEAGTEGLLLASVEAYMSGSKEVNEDIVRLFFRTKVKDIGVLIDRMNALVIEYLESNPGIEKRSKTIIESNRYILATLSPSFKLRQQQSEIYGLDKSTRGFESWMAKSVMLNVLETTYDRTKKLLRDRSRELGSSIDDNPEDYQNAPNTKTTQKLLTRQSEQEELRQQLCSIAELTIESYEDRIEYLKASSKTEKELAVLLEKFNGNLRPSLIHPLVTIGKADFAFDLAENHRAFSILTELCTDVNVGSMERIKYYLDMYKEQFGFELYKWYVENGKLWTLFQHEQPYGDLLQAFFKQSDNGRFAWMHDLSAGKYIDASQTLIKESSKETELAPKHLILSLGKLSHIAQLDLDTFESTQAQQDIEATDDKLDLISIHGKLLELFGTQLSETGENIDMLDLEEKVAKITDVVASRLNLPNLINHFHNLIRGLYNGKALNAEDLVDLLTLKDNFLEQVTDYASAIDVCVRAKDVPDRRAHSSLKSIWRRVYLRDDWPMLNNTTGMNDNELGDNLRQSALYATIQLASENDHPEALFLSPKKSFNKLSEKDLSARFPSLPQDEVAAILSDLQEENARLESLIKNNNLDNWYKEVLRLHSEDHPKYQVAKDEQEQEMDES
ncbi:hypothetical protein E3Q10_01047 [Wallemia mellicola]|uniref:Nucleoporin-domain-containing protein n=1 Tax=Wallemia mellicola TaxID=1708541 RepID=A0A4T0R707_9BASI|nr:hypothetical protein E3Q15_01975 [Wallemia mellicola]TIC32790.1 hypothetical protein E3Q10_01047 [Wallemia mellicola]TIC57227.1 hypothetical protein E3Q05_01356 [Wallemia mellicola]